MKRYNIIRFYAPHINKRNKIIARGLTLEEAQKHCSDPSTSCSSFFDGYTEDK